MTRAAPRRIVSLVPSLTELLFALGAGDALVAATRYCTDPPERVARLPKVRGTKNPDVGAIVALRPDLVVMNAEENRRDDFVALRDAGLAVLVTEPKSVDDGIALVAELGAAVGRAELGRQLADAQRAGVDAVRVAARGATAYFCPIWRKPWMAFNADTYAHDVLRTAGGRNVVADRAGRYPEVTLDEIAAAAPAIVLLPDEPYRFTTRDLPALAPLATVPDLACLATPERAGDRVRFVDGKALSWYGLRIADAVATFARLFDEARAFDRSTP